MAESESARTAADGDGALRDDTTMSVLDAESLLLAVFGAITDSEEQPNRLESFLRSVIDVVFDVILVLDDSGTVRWASRPATAGPNRCRIDVTGRSTTELMHPEDVVMVHDLTERVRGGAGAQSVEGRMLAPDGSWHWMRIRISDLREVEEWAAWSRSCPT
ncbi:MAG: PAS domain-containing protein [Microthrixaceae bacterium]|nr:PAS domain-containing protein [Microthrixaceae bacterium]